VHFRVAELYKKKGDFESAAQIYEDCNLLEHAAKCYERLGKVDKMTLYLLGEGKEHEAVALYEKAGRTAKAKWVNKVAKFHLATFEHPLLRRSPPPGIPSSSSRS